MWTKTQTAGGGERLERAGVKCNSEDSAQGVPRLGDGVFAVNTGQKESILGASQSRAGPEYAPGSPALTQSHGGGWARGGRPRGAGRQAARGAHSGFSKETAALTGVAQWAEVMPPSER